jgi:GTP-binding protein HflX
VLLDRRGYVEWVLVGTHQKVFLPDLGSRRAGRQHFRGLRLVYATLHPDGLTRDVLTDLALLRLDYVAAVKSGPEGLPGRVFGAHLLPGDTSFNPWRKEEFVDPHELTQDFLEVISALETEFAKKVGLPDVESGRERAVLVSCAARVSQGEDSLWELSELARTAEVEVVGQTLQVRPKPDPHYVIGKGKLEEIVVTTLQKGASLIIFGSDLTPAQARMIANATELKVLDRTQLILDIFARRALSRDGKLQVELAQLKYRLPRLTEQDSGLSRLTGGIGGQGPGETKLEIDRRRARERITRLEREIDKLSKRRAIRRGARQRNRLPVVAIIGYTNTGKSTLLNAFTRSSVVVEDKLFATLDPTSRRLRFPHERQVIVTDTVGFIRDLPKDLISAFRATLEELEHANLLLHVADASDERLEDQTAAVEGILEKLDLALVPRLLVLNKCDRIESSRVAALARRTGGIPISATAKTGFEDLLAAIEERLWRQGAAEKNMQPYAAREVWQ